MKGLLLPLSFASQFLTMVSKHNALAVDILGLQLKLKGCYPLAETSMVRSTFCRLLKDERHLAVPVSILGESPLPRSFAIKGGVCWS